MLEVVCWAGSDPFPPVSLQRQVVCLLLWPVFMCSFRERLHCFLVGWCTNKSYVIATSDLWLFIHASNLLSLNSPSPLPYISTNSSPKMRHIFLKMFALSSDKVYSKFSHSQSFCMKKLKPTFPEGFLFSKKSTVFSSSGACSNADLMTTAMYNIVYKLQCNSCTAIHITV